MGGPLDDLRVDVHADRVWFWVQASPGAKRSQVVGLHGDALKVRIAAPPAEGRANEALLRLLSDLFGCRVDLAHGSTARRKCVEVGGHTPQQVRERLQGALADG